MAFFLKKKKKKGAKMAKWPTGPRVPGRYTRGGGYKLLSNILGGHPVTKLGPDHERIGQLWGAQLTILGVSTSRILQGQDAL